MPPSGRANISAKCARRPSFKRIDSVMKTHQHNSPPPAQLVSEHSPALAQRQSADTEPRGRGMSLNYGEDQDDEVTLPVDFNRLRHGRMEAPTGLATPFMSSSQPNLLTSTADAGTPTPPSFRSLPASMTDLTSVDSMKEPFGSTFTSDMNAALGIFIDWPTQALEDIDTSSMATAASSDSIAGSHDRETFRSRPMRRQKARRNVDMASELKEGFNSAKSSRILPTLTKTEREDRMAKLKGLFRRKSLGFSYSDGLPGDEFMEFECPSGAGAVEDIEMESGGFKHT